MSRAPVFPGQILTNICSSVLQLSIQLWKCVCYCRRMNDELKILCLLQFFPEVAQNSLRIPWVFHVQRNPWVFQVSRFVATLSKNRDASDHGPSNKKYVKHISDRLSVITTLTGSSHWNTVSFVYICLHAMLLWPQRRRQRLLLRLLLQLAAAATTTTTAS